MLIVETIAKVRRAYFSDGKSIKAICRELRLSRKVVRKVIRSGETSFSYERTVQPRPKLGQWTTTLGELLEANAAKPAREQLTLIRIFEELRGPVTGAATTPFGATPGGGPTSAGNRRPRPTCRCPSRRGRPSSSTGATRSSC